MYPRSSIFVRIFKFSIFVTTCITVYNIVSIVTVSKGLTTQVTVIRTEEHQRRLRFHYNNILNNSSFLQNPSHLCAISYIFLIIYVHSAPENAKRQCETRELTEIVWNLSRPGRCSLWVPSKAQPSWKPWAWNPNVTEISYRVIY